MAQANKLREKETGPRGAVNLRMSPEDRNVIDRAAQTAGKSRTEFMIEAARRAAHETLLDTTLIITDRETFRQYQDLLDAPPSPNEGLRRLMSQKSPWEP